MFSRGTKTRVQSRLVHKTKVKVSVLLSDAFEGVGQNKDVR